MLVFRMSVRTLYEAPRVAAAAGESVVTSTCGHFLTPTARYADIVLPATTFWERNDLHTPWAGPGHYVIFMRQAIAPVGECRNDFDICTDLHAASAFRDITTGLRKSGCASSPARRSMILRRSGSAASRGCPRPRTPSRSRRRSVIPSPAGASAFNSTFVDVVRAG